jgi:hypothetical protein
MFNFLQQNNTNTFFWSTYSTATLGAWMAYVKRPLQLVNAGVVNELELTRMKSELANTPQNKMLVVDQIRARGGASGMVTTPFCAVSMVKVPTVAYEIRNRQFSAVFEDKKETIQTARAMVVEEDFKDGYPINSSGAAKVLARHLSTTTTVINGVVVSIAPPKETAASRRWTSQILATVQQDLSTVALQGGKGDPLPSNMGGQALAVKLYEKMKNETYESLLVGMNQIATSLPETVQNMLHRMYRAFRDGDRIVQKSMIWGGGKMYKDTTFPIEEKKIAKESEVTIVTSAITTQLEVWGGKTAGYIQSALDSFDGVPLARDRRVHVSLHYDLLMLGFMDADILVLNSTDSQLGFYISKQLKKGAVLVMSAQKRTNKVEIDKVCNNGGIIMLEDLSAAACHSVFKSKAICGNPYDKLDIAYYNPDCPSLGNGAEGVMREEAATILKAVLRGQGEYPRMAVMIPMLAITYRTPPLNPLKDPKIEVEVERVKKYNKITDNYQYCLSTKSAIGYMVLLTEGVDTPHVMSREKVIASVPILNHISKGFHLHGYTMQDYFEHRGIPPVTLTMKLTGDVEAMSVFGTYDLANATAVEELKCSMIDLQENLKVSSSTGLVPKDVDEGSEEESLDISSDSESSSSSEEEVKRKSKRKGKTKEKKVYVKKPKKNKGDDLTVEVTDL